MKNALVTFGLFSVVAVFSSFGTATTTPTKTTTTEAKELVTILTTPAIDGDNQMSSIRTVTRRY